LVDLSEIQAVYYMVAATGVIVAAIFYILNLRETTNNRIATFANNRLQTTLTEDWILRSTEIMNMQWSDFEDFKKKYDSSVDPQIYAKRLSLWASYDSIGRMYRQGTINLDYIGSASGLVMVLAWLKFKPIIVGYRGWEYPNDAFSDFEYIANAYSKRLSDSDPDFMKKVNTFFTTPPVNQ
jgi:hypothetical protein